MHAGRWSVAVLALALFAIGIGAAASAAEVPIPSSPARWATDTAGFLKPQTVAGLDARLRAYQTQTGHQVLVYVAPTTGTTPTEDWTVRAFARWKVGRKGLDDGLILFVFPTDRKVRIEVGYGLEQTVPDATAARIIRDTITPKIRAGRPDDAVVAGIDAILGTVGGEASGNGNGNGKAGRSTVSGAGPAQRTTPAPYDAQPQRDWGEIFGELFGILICVLIVLGIIVTIAKLPSPKGTYISSRGSGWDGWSLAGDILGGVLSAGFSGGGGGFSGGGGMSGGGGATGSW